MFFKTLYPTLPGVPLAPTTAMLFGLKKKDMSLLVTIFELVLVDFKINPYRVLLLLI